MKQQVKILNKLIRLNKNSEEGFRVAAESVKNRGLKALLKAYAQQRQQFRTELEGIVRGLNGRPYDKSSKLGGLHRGWIVIKASLTIGAENTEKVVLLECCRGESYALQTYQKSLNEALPLEIHEVILRQYDSLQSSAREVIELSGNENGRLVVRLFNNDADADVALDALHTAGFDDEHIRTLVFNQQNTIYTDSDEKRKTMTETAVAGAVGGAVLGSVLGLFSGVGLLIVPDIGLSSSLTSPQLMMLIVLAGLLVGLAIGAFFGFLISMSTLEQDSYLYKKSTQQGQVLMMVDSDRAQAQVATDIMRQVNIDHVYSPV